MTSWLNQDFPFQSPSTSGVQFGYVTGVPADGSETVTVQFPQYYTDSNVAVVLTISSGGSWDGYQLVAEVDNITASSFGITVSGGPLNSIVTVYWISMGVIVPSDGYYGNFVGGTFTGISFVTSLGPGTYSGNGAPTISAANGSLYLRFDGTSGSRVYVNSSGASLAGTSWTPIA
jgi:hypothetical protein